MKRLVSTKSLAAVAVALGAFAAASAAHARSDVYFSIGVQAPYGYVQPAPVYVQPAPVYLQPRPVYVAPRHVYVDPQPVYGWGQYRWERGRRHANRWGPNGDLDRDGTANRYDRDRDGDGIRNRQDRFPQNPYRY